jgi:hypothetical protein
MLSVKAQALCLASQYTCFQGMIGNYYTHLVTVIILKEQSINDSVDIRTICLVARESRKRLFKQGDGRSLPVFRPDIGSRFWRMGHPFASLI